MIADLSRVASTIREDSLTARLARMRDEILKALRETGSYTFREGGRRFTITVKAPQPAGPTPDE